MLLIVLMFLLPLISTVVECGYGNFETSVGPLLLKWFVFWGVGVRLLLAGLRQMREPSFTAQKILGVADEKAFILVRELGFANTTIGILGIASLFFASWVTPAAVAGMIFLGLAGINHLQQPERNARENLSMITDLAMAAVLAVLIGLRLS